ncbi:UNVERIFIED_CONTAM: copper amine oxidase-like protein [Acetivibrio alkalicellulosi]
MRKISVLLVITMVFVSVFTSFASNEVKVTVDGKLIDFDVKPYIDTNGRTMIPVRFVSEKLGCEVDWDDINKVVTVNKGDTSIVLKIGESKATVNDEVMVFDTSAVIMSGRTMVPLRFVSEALGARVGWDGKTRTVSIVTVDMFYEPFTVEEQERLNQYEDNIGYENVIRTDMDGNPSSHYSTREEQLSTEAGIRTAHRVVETAKEYFSLYHAFDYRTVDKDEYIKKLGAYYSRENAGKDRYDELVGRQYIMIGDFKTDIYNVYVDHGQLFRIRGVAQYYIENDLDIRDNRKQKTWYEMDLEFAFYYDPDDKHYKYRKQISLSEPREMRR